MTECTPPGLSVEGQEAILLMPVKVLTSDCSVGPDGKDAVEEHNITTKIGIVKHTIRGRCCNGREGLQDMVPHVMEVKQIIDRCGTQNNLSDYDKVLVFLACSTGVALQDGHESLNELSADLQDANNNDVNFDAFLKNHLAREGTDDDAESQQNGMQCLHKPRACKVRRWENAWDSKNNACAWVEGNYGPLEGQAKVKKCFESHPKGWRDAHHDNAAVKLSNASMADVTSHVKDREKDARLKDLTKGRETSKTNKRQHDKTRGDNEAPGGRAKRSKKDNQRTRKHKGDGAPRRGRHPNRPSNCCFSCPHEHLWKDCPHNKNNPKNILGTLKAPPTSDGGHNAAIREEPATSPVAGESAQFAEPVSDAKSFEGSANNCMCASDNIEEETHFLEHCFSTLQLEPSLLLSPDHAIPTSDVSPMLESRQCGSPCRKTTSKTSLACGMPPNESDVASLDTTKEAEEEVSMDAACEAVSCALCDTDDTDPVSVTDLSAFKIDERFKTTINHADDAVPMPLSRHDIVRGADTPMTIITIGTPGGIKFRRPLRALIDSGSTRSFMCRSALPSGVALDETKSTRTKLLNQSTAIASRVKLEDAPLPELSTSMKTRKDDIFAHAAEAEAACFDLILGQDFNVPLGIDTSNSKRVMQWMGEEVPFRKVPASCRRFREMQQQCTAAHSPEDEQFECHATAIEASKCDKADVADVAAQQHHLSKTQQKKLERLLRQFPKLFSGDLGLHPHKKISLDVDPNVAPKCKRHCPVANAHLQVFKDELDRLCKIGVLKKCGASRWGSPTFVIPKKDNAVRWVSDLRELNKAIRRRVHPLPKINDTLRKRCGYKFLTKLDISMQHYTFELDDAAKEACVITAPHGNCQCQRLPMGCCQSSDVAQEIMESTLSDLKDVECHMDDIAVFSDDFDKHLQLLDVVLTRLQNNNFTINPLKCEWAVQETDFLGHWLTPTGIKPWKKKIDGVLKLDRPKNLTDVRSFAGAVNFHGDMHPRRSHMLNPLHESTGLADKGKFEWLPHHQKAFDAMKAVMATEAYVRCPDHNLPFHVYADASDCQLGAVIVQNNRPVAFYGKKLNAAQRNYTTVEKELLSTCSAFKEFRTMLCGCKEPHVHTDHKNLTYANLNSQRVMRWRLFLEEFNPTFHCIKGKENTFADALSRLPLKEDESATAVHSANAVTHKGRRRHAEIEIGDDQSKQLPPANDVGFSFAIFMDDPETAECFLNFPDADSEHPFALDCDTMSQAQAKDAMLQHLMQHGAAGHFKVATEHGSDLVCHRKNPGDKARVCMPDSMLETIASFHHRVLGHAGASRAHKAVALHFKHNKIKETAKRISKTCDACQRHKNDKAQCGELPPRVAHDTPWSDVAADLIGPWTIRDENGFDHEFRALTIVDTVTNHCEIIRIKNKTAEHVAMQFENNWLARCPKPNMVVVDPGSEFKGKFREMLAKHNIEPVVTSVKHPQGNSVCERLHQTVADVLRPLVFTAPPQHSGESADLVDSALATAAYATRTALHATLGLSPGMLAFNGDMLLDVPVSADLKLLRDKRQIAINKSVERANKRRVQHDHRVGDKVLRRVHDPTKLQERFIGPFEVDQVFANGTISIKRSDTTSERLNLRKTKPCNEPIVAASHAIESSVFDL